MNESIILLGGGPTCFAAIRELRNTYKNLYLISASKFELSRFSRSIEYLGWGNPEYDEKRILNILYGFRRISLGKIVLVPTGDEYVEFLEKYRNILKRDFVASIFGHDSLPDIIDKKRFAKLCCRLDIPAPNTWHSELNISLDEWADNVSYPCFIKPDIYHHWKKYYGLKKGFIVKNKEELLNVFYSINFDKANLVVQEIIGGEDDNIAILSCCMDKGQLLDVFTGRKIRQYPYGFGTTTMAISEHIPEITVESEKILRELNYQGVCDVEFKYDEKTGKYLIIEINARLGRWYSLVSKSGKFPLTNSINKLLKNKTSENGAMKEDIVWIFFLRDFWVLFKNKNISFFRNLKYYLSFKKQVHCIFSLSDILPFFMYFFEVFTKVFSYVRKKA